GGGCGGSRFAAALALGASCDRIVTLRGASTVAAVVAAEIVAGLAATRVRRVDVGRRASMGRAGHVRREKVPAGRATCS
ncbi:MAG TPA: hypothetical protein PKW35_24015, partial [Nannocystaceae bacterium]|nr:hypothetical protein [Nannocystaceae bacterium]